MKRTLYLLPAVLVCILYGMLALLAGGFASFQLKAWAVVLLPLVSAVLLLKGFRWGFLPGALLGAGLICTGLFAGQTLGLDMILGVAFLVYYLIMGILAVKKN